jgi:lysine-specific histone demethylase 1
MWVDNPKLQLVIEDVLNKLDAHLVKNEKILIIRIYKYLERYSYINFGVFKRIIPLTSIKWPPQKRLLTGVGQLSINSCFFYPSQNQASPKGKVIIIGAGIAGLAAARQLREFGFEVTIYEARVSH